MNTIDPERLLWIFVSQISTIDPWDDGDYIVIMKGGTVANGFLVTRAEAEALRLRLDSAR